MASTAACALEASRAPALIRRFKTMIEAVANQMRERIADLLDHALVEFGALADQLQAHLLAKLAGEIVDHAREAREHRRSEEHTSELQSLMRISYAVFCLKKKNTKRTNIMSQTATDN